MGRKKIKTKQIIMEQIIADYKRWKQANQSDDSRYYYIQKFLAGCGRNRLISLMDFAESIYDKMQLDGKN